MNAARRVRELIEPPLLARGLEVVDVEMAGSTLRVTLDRPGGIDLDTVSDATRLVSDMLDHDDPLPGRRYVLEVSSPGVERPLRTPEHFRRFVGATVEVTASGGTERRRRLRGVLEAADHESVVVAGNRLCYGEVERARTVFEWGPPPRRAPRPKGRRAPARGGAGAARAAGQGP